VRSNASITRFTLIALAIAVLASIAPSRGFTDSLVVGSLMTNYYDVASSNLPTASGYGGNGASGGVGDGLVRIVNAGNLATEQRGTLCAMLYVFDDIEEMQACCGCPVTPDGLRTMSVINNLTKNFGVNRGNTNAGVIDILSAAPNLFIAKPVPLPAQISPIGASGWVCDPSSQYANVIGLPATLPDLVDGLRAWETHTEGAASVPAGAGLIKGVSVSEFQTARFDAGHTFELFDLCFFLITNGSGSGACSCGSGDNVSVTPEPIFQ